MRFGEKMLQPPLLLVSIDGSDFTIPQHSIGVEFTIASHEQYYIRPCVHRVHW